MTRSANRQCYQWTRDAVISEVRRFGARAVYGPAWSLNDADTIAKVTAYPREYIVSDNCDHFDEKTGRCLGHNR